MSGIEQLGYVGFEVSNLSAWESFATEVLGLEVTARQPSGAFALRMDGHQQRIFVEPGAGDDLAFLGWQVSDTRALGTLAARVYDAGFPVVPLTQEESAARGVQRLVKYRDPDGIPSELFVGPARAREPFKSNLVTKGFAADELGLGHVVISARKHRESKEFYENVLGLRLSDQVIANAHGYPVNISFFHIAGSKSRHHSIGFANPQNKRLHHFMLEVNSMDDVGRCLDRTWRSGLRIMQTLGRHTNDRMVSFHAKTPSGFLFEYGWGGREVDDAFWEPATYDHISEWGHQPPQYVVQPPPPPPLGTPNLEKRDERRRRF